MFSYSLISFATTTTSSILFKRSTFVISSSSHYKTTSHFSKPLLLSSSARLFTARRFAARATYSEITAALNILGVKIDDTKDTKAFKKKYLDLVRKNHPDRGGSEDRMKDITTAFELLTNLSDFDRKEYSTKNRYSGGSSNPARNQAYQQRASQQQNAYDFQDMYRRQYESGNMNSSGKSSSNYSTYQGQTQTNDPFGHWRGGSHTGSGESTGNFSRTMYQARRLPTSILFFRALVAYSVVVMFVVIMQRASDDYTNQSGWAAASKQARQDRLEQIFESRQEFIDKLRDRDLRMRMDKERQKEKRMYDYAAQRQAELNRMEFGSFPPLPTDGRLGSVFKIPADPVGILYYEPPMKNSFEGAMLQQKTTNTNGNNQPTLSGNMVNGGVSQKQQLDPMFGQRQNLVPTEANHQQSAPPPYAQQQQQTTANLMQPVSSSFGRNSNYDGTSRSSPNGFASGNFSLAQQGSSQPTVDNLNRNYSDHQNQNQNQQRGSNSNSNNLYTSDSDRQRQRTELLRQEAKELQRQSLTTVSSSSSGNRRDPDRRGDGKDYDPTIDTYGHEGMVAKPMKS